MSILNGHADADKYIYIESAVNGLNQRNQIHDMREWTPPAGTTDTFVSVMRYTEAFAAYVAERKTVKHFAGDALLRVLAFDFDNKDDPAAALADAGRMHAHLIALGVPPAGVRAFFSGDKGAHLVVDARALGGPYTGPCRELARHAKRFARALAADAGVRIDESVYDGTRLLRVVNTRHGGSGLFKVRLTPDELKAVNIDYIRAIAAEPRELS